MTAKEIRESFLQFFREKEHTIVPSASLLPQSPGLLFTNAGMNQFVPYFLGEQNAPYAPPRAADTQKCIRAGGKHNDLEDVGQDTYHHTFFEMLGNWSFGNYFKEEAINWAWELVVERWGLPPERLYATVYQPGEGDPSHFDQEAHDLWKALFEKAGCDPAVHIVNGNVKDNFWMMGDTGPCGPCSELHVDLTPAGDTKGSLVNKDSDLCIEIWNLVFIQYNAEPDGTFRDLPARHVDTGMGFERACSLIQNTDGFKDFSKKPTNYNTDLFSPIFAKLEELSGRPYTDIYPDAEATEHSGELKTAIAFRVIADHLRTLSFSIADGILPGNTGRNYVLRRILRRAVRYGRNIGFDGREPFLPKLVETLVAQMGEIFPELRERKEAILETLRREEESFNQTLDRGLTLFDQAAAGKTTFPAAEAFKLYDTFGFPLDLTALLCRERGLALDEDAVEALMEEARKLSQAARKTTVVAAVDLQTDAVTEFVGFEADSAQATVLELHPQEEHLLVITDQTPFYAEMGGQEGDEGALLKNGSEYLVSKVQQIGQARGHLVPPQAQLEVGDTVTLQVHAHRRRPIEAHHTATHLLHWALHEVVSKDATQQGSLVAPDRLRFDFSSGALNPEQLSEVEHKVNARIAADDAVSWREVPHREVRERDDIMQFFGDKYGDLVRVVQIGGAPGALDGYSMELCGGTHVRRTGAIGLFKIKKEEAIASGVRRIEAVCGEAAEAYVADQFRALLGDLDEAQGKLARANEALQVLDSETLAPPEAPAEETLETLAAHLQAVKETAVEAEKKIKKVQTANAARQADAFLARVVEENAEGNVVASLEGPAALLQELLNGLKKLHFDRAAFLVVDDGDKLHLGALCGERAHNSGHGAGHLIKDLAPLAGGKGGGKPDMARGAAPERGKKDALLAAARETLG